MLEQVGTAHTIGAFREDDLVGFIIVLVAVLPHFGRRVASTESFFVAQSERKSGAGLQLLREAERLARELGAVGFFVSAPIGSRLASVMPRARYREASTIFFRSFA
jgi:GNAT superfamily N-acetyltransferase